MPEKCLTKIGGEAGRHCGDVVGIGRIGFVAVRAWCARSAAAAGTITQERAISMIFANPASIVAPGQYRITAALSKGNQCRCGLCVPRMNSPVRLTFVVAATAGRCCDTGAALGEGCLLHGLSSDVWGFGLGKKIRAALRYNSRTFRSRAGRADGGRFILVSQFLLRLLPELVFLAFWPAMALPDLISALLDFFFGVTRCAAIPVRGSRQFRPNVSEPKPRRSICVVGYRPRVSAALLSLPSIPFCICRCHALSCAAGRSVPGDDRDADDIASRTIPATAQLTPRLYQPPWK
jgi:hypothetical protein